MEILKTPPKGIALCTLDIIVMPNGEVLHKGRSLGFINNEKHFLKGSIKIIQNYGEDNTD